MLTDLHLSQIMPHAAQSRRQAFLPFLAAAMQRYKVDNLPRAAAFLAQLAHESGELQYMEEIWGPTAAQRRYEPDTPLSRDLGNTQKGDGFRFKGRGPIQVTGRANYARYGQALGVDLVATPELAAKPDLGFAIAGVYWTKNGLNALADAGDFKAITRRINGGYNGLAEREAYYRRAKQVLAGAFPVAPAAAARGKGKEAPLFPRGAESLPTAAQRASAAPQLSRLDARPDAMDFRDLMYTPSLVEVPTLIPLGDYLEHDVPVLDQGSEGACTGYGLATVANYLLRRRRVRPDTDPVSPRMFYKLARRYDEWPGEDYSGSSARGAMKGWHKHGVCSSSLWSKPGHDGAGLNAKRAADACHRPLGAYFRVNHKNLVAMHSAIAEVGVLYATAMVHSGWDEVDDSGTIVMSDTVLGGHAFAIVAYDEQGFWIQNSWGTGWGRRGFGRISYDDWLANGTDVWVARLGAPVVLSRPEATAQAHSRAGGQSATYSYADLRPHIISVGNNGSIKPGGDYGSTADELAHVFANDIPQALKGFDAPRILLYAHGGLVGEQAAVQRLAEYRPTLLGSGVYPLAFIWRTDYWTTITNILQDAVRRRRPEGALDAAKDFMLDRLDDALEPLARALSGKAAWDEMKENALRASEGQGAAVLVADHLKALAKQFPKLEIHLVGHSAGSILHGPVVKLLGDRGLKIATTTLWAPACTVDLFRQYYLPAIKRKAIGRFALFALRDDIERADNCAKIYNKSLLYMVSNAFEAKARIPMFRDGVPILGMDKFLTRELRDELSALGADVVFAPNGQPMGSPLASEATHHGDFDDDERTVAATFGRILAAGGAAGEAPSAAARKRGGLRAATTGVAAPRFHRSGSSLREQRQAIDAKTQPGK